MTDEKVKYFQVRPRLGTLQEAFVREDMDPPPRVIEVGEREVVYESGRREILVSFRVMQGSRCQASFRLNREDLRRLLDKDD